MTRAATPRFLFLPSAMQRRRRDGRPQPHRLYLANGTEVVGVSEITAHSDFEVQQISASTLADKQKPEPSRVRFCDVTLLFKTAEVRTITRKPARRRAAR